MYFVVAAVAVAVAVVVVIEMAAALRAAGVVCADKKKEENQLKEEIAKEALIKELYVMSVNKSAAQVLRILFGVKDDNQPYNIIMK